MDLPRWVDVGIVVFCIMLAVFVLGMTLARSRAIAGDGEEVAGRDPFDPMLFISALAVLALAVVAYFLI